MILILIAIPADAYAMILILIAIPADANFLNGYALNGSVLVGYVLKIRIGGICIGGIRLRFLLMHTFWMDTHSMDTYWWDTCWTDTYWWDTYCKTCWCKPFEWIRIAWIRTGGIRVERIRIGGIRIGGIRFEWICVGYVWSDGYVWDMSGVRYANNLLKNPATKRLSGKRTMVVLIWFMLYKKQGVDDWCGLILVSIMGVAFAYLYSFYIILRWGLTYFSSFGSLHQW